LTIQYKGRELDAARLTLIATKQCPVIQVDPTKLNFLDLLTEATELLVHPNGERYDVLGGALPSEDSLSVAMKKKKPEQRTFSARLVSKQMLKKIEDLTLNGSEVAPLVEPPPYRPYVARSDNYDRAQQRFDRNTANGYGDRPAYQPRPNGEPYQPSPKGPPYAPAPGQRPAQARSTGADPVLTGSLQQSMQKLSTGLRIKTMMQPLEGAAQGRPVETGSSHRPILNTPRR
jgi:hypothetical protein